MPTPSHPAEDKGRTLPGLLFLSALWLQFCYVLAPSWEGGTYYDYGWLAPPVIAFFAYSRWNDRLNSPTTPQNAVWIKILIALGILSLIPIRVIQHVDALWRLPLWAHACTLLALTHLTIGFLKGWRRSLYLMPATFLILVAVPLPFGVQTTLVEVLTQLVLDLSHKTLPILGYPAVLSGSSFVVDGKMLDVAEGCSGIRSFQSCIMAALALGELSRFKIPKRITLLILALAVAVVANATRIVVLIRIAYNEGHDAMDKAHDGVGLWTAIVTYLVIGAVSWLMGYLSQKKGRVVRRKV